MVEHLAVDEKYAGSHQPQENPYVRIAYPVKRLTKDGECVVRVHILTEVDFRPLPCGHLAVDQKDASPNLVPGASPVKRKDTAGDWDAKTT